MLSIAYLWSDPTWLYYHAMNTDSGLCVNMQNVMISTMCDYHPIDSATCSCSTA